MLSLCPSISLDLGSVLEIHQLYTTVMEGQLESLSCSSICQVFRGTPSFEAMEWDICGCVYKGRLNCSIKEIKG